MRTTAGGGTGKTPPGTGCNPGAVMREESQKLEKVLVERREKRDYFALLKALAWCYIRARWRGWKGIIWLVSGLGYSGLRSTSSFNVGTEGATTVSGSIAASLARDTSCKHRTKSLTKRREQKNEACRRGLHLVAEGFEFTGGAGVQVHELVSIYQQGRFLALIFIFEGTEPSALHLQNTGQVSDVALKSQEPSPDFTAGIKTHWK